MSPAGIALIVLVVFVVAAIVISNKKQKDE